MKLILRNLSNIVKFLFIFYHLHFKDMTKTCGASILFSLYKNGGHLGPWSLFIFLLLLKYFLTD